MSKRWAPLMVLAPAGRLAASTLAMRPAAVSTVFWTSTEHIHAHTSGGDAERCCQRMALR